MPFRIGPVELIIVLVIVVLIFGVGRLPQVGGAMGKAVREFRQSVSPRGGDINSSEVGPDNKTE